MVWCAQYKIYKYEHFWEVEIVKTIHYYKHNISLTERNERKKKERNQEEKSERLVNWLWLR